MYQGVFSKIYERAAKIMCFDCKDFIKKGDKILDVGCGSGIVGKNFRDFFNAEILGVDIKDKRTVSLPFKIIDGMSLPFSDSSFDVVLISYVLHHSKNPEALLNEAKRVGKKIIIYEDLPEGVLAKLRCNFHQIIYNFLQKENQKGNFKTKKEWQGLFDKLGLKTIVQKKVSTPFAWLDPGKRILFVLEAGV